MEPQITQISQMFETGITSSAPTSFANKFRALSADIKLHHSIFALPWALLATILAAARSGGLHWIQLGLVLICMISARTFAMTANRLFDAEMDAKNPRTARRAVPAGALSAGFMALTMFTSGAIFILGTLGFYFVYHNVWPMGLGLPVLAFLGGYPFLKRFSRLCHYYLGAALALAPVCAWIAIKGSLDAPPLYMAAAVLFWTAGFDILYACQDYAFDVANQLFSVPANFGVSAALWIARLTHLVALGFLILLGVQTTELHTLYWIGVAIAGGLLMAEHSLVKPDDLSKLNLAFFTINGIISLLLGTLGAIDILIRH